jgi:hypothetical protein
MPVMKMFDFNRHRRKELLRNQRRGQRHSRHENIMFSVSTNIYISPTATPHFATDQCVKPTSPHRYYKFCAACDVKSLRHLYERKVQLKLILFFTVAPAEPGATARNGPILTSLADSNPQSGGKIAVG